LFPPPPSSPPFTIHNPQSTIHSTQQPALSAFSDRYGLAREKDPDFTMSLFEIGIVGVPVAMAGILYCAVIGPRLLPSRESHFVDAVQGITE
jgi:hypothetical protein